MNRRELIKRGGGVVALAAFKGGPLVGVTGLAVVTAACPRDKAITNIGIVIDALEEARPILVSLVPSAEGPLTRALAVARDLKKALEKKSPDALGFLRQLIAPDGLFNQITASLGLIGSESQRRTVSAILLLANIGLRVIAANLQEAADTTTGAETAAVGSDPAAVAAIKSAAASVEPALKQLKF